MADNVKLRFIKATKAISWPSAPSLVLCLLPWRGPSAIGWAIWSIVVNAINRVDGRWLRANIAKKCLKAISPFIAYYNATSTIILKRIEIAISASLNHVAPCIVFWGSGLFVGTSQSTNGFSLKATAATMLAHRQVTTANKNCRTTFAITNPSGLAGKASLSAQHCQPTEHMAC